MKCSPTGEHTETQTEEKPAVELPALGCVLLPCSQKEDKVEVHIPKDEIDDWC